MKGSSVTGKTLLWILTAILCTAFFIAYNDGRNDSEKNVGISFSASFITLKG